MPQPLTICVCQAQLQRSLERQVLDVNYGAGLRMLKLASTRLTKGEASMRLQVWRFAVRLSLQAQQASLKVAMQASANRSGLNRLKLTLCHITKGGISLRLEVWRDNKKLGEREYEQERQLRLQLEIRKRMHQACLHSRPCE
jgi:hypothetical protein